MTTYTTTIEGANNGAVLNCVGNYPWASSGQRHEKDMTHNIRTPQAVQNRPLHIAKPAGAGSTDAAGLFALAVCLRQMALLRYVAHTGAALRITIS